ncbi:hypothetical protein ACFSTC_02265 [Nonomuraea ferruginea]
MRLAVLAEHWRGEARGRSDVVYLFAGDRLGLGLLIGGAGRTGARTPPPARSGVSRATTGGRSGIWPTTRWPSSRASCALTGRPPSSPWPGRRRATSAREPPSGPSPSTWRRACSRSSTRSTRSWW